MIEINRLVILPTSKVSLTKWYNVRECGAGIVFTDVYYMDQEPAIGEEAAKESDAGTDLPTVSAADSDMESGSLVIDEEEKKKSMKRRTMPGATTNPVIYLCLYTYISVSACAWLRV